jgi:DNA-binding NarL/FixJ family response regulator
MSDSEREPDRREGRSLVGTDGGYAHAPGGDRGAQLQAAIRRAVRSAALALIARTQTPAQVIVALAAAVDGQVPTDVTPREAAAAARQAHLAHILAEIVRLEKDGHGRAAASILAKTHAADPRDPVEVETLANKYRRWVRSEKRASARLAASKKVMSAK